MEGIVADISSPFGAEGGGGDRTDCLASVARLLQALDPSLVLVADRYEELMSAEQTGSQAGPGGDAALSFRIPLSLPDAKPDQADPHAAMPSLATSGEPGGEKSRPRPNRRRKFSGLDRWIDRCPPELIRNRDAK